MKHFRLFFSVFFFFFFIITPAYADYVLLYPSAMPGGISYKVHLVWEKIMQYWYFGNFGQFEYNVKESDKYLVEAKTLFEYQQYYLGYSALQKSDRYFANTLPYLQKAKEEGKNISAKRTLLHDVAQKHISVLQQMQQSTPATFFWQPEKSAASQLQLHKAIELSIHTRMKYL